MKKSIFLSIFIFVFLGIFSSAFAQINVINPASGVWANKQMLVIDTSKGGDFYYSIDDSDPAMFGFAYDKPVLLNVTGNVNLKIARILSDGNSESVTVKYSVNPDNAKNKAYENFVSSFYDAGILNYTAGSKLEIPSDLSYKLNDFVEYIEGTSLSLSSKNVLSRYIPCVVKAKDSSKVWRFVIRTLPQYAAANTTRSVPFRIENWENIVFTDNNVLYKIDGEFWQLSSKNRKIDRSISHMISWQNVEYHKGNPVDYCILPQKPELKTVQEKDGSFSYIVSGDKSYKLSVLSDSKEYSELYPEIGADVFFGDNTQGNLKIGFFANSVFQGELDASYNIDKCPPVTPFITPDFDGFYSRKRVRMNIKTEPQNKLFVAVTKPLIIENVTQLSDEYIEELKHTKTGDYYNFADEIDLELLESKEGAVFYKIQAYSKNEISNSPVVDYCVIIDHYNYFFDSSAPSENANGSAAHPYNSIKKCIEEINKCDSVCLRVKGIAEFPPQQIEITSDCEILSDENAVFDFVPGSSLLIKSKVSLNCGTLKKSAGNSENIFNPLIKIDGGSLKIDKVQIAGNFGKNGLVFDAANANLTLMNVIASVDAVSYSSFISADNSNINLKNCTVNTSGSTCVLLSTSNCGVYASDNQLKVSGNSGRIAQLLDSSAVFDSNIYKCELIKNNDNAVVFANAGTKLKEVNNTNYEF